jgi:leucine dehydrogenase
MHVVVQGLGAVGMGCVARLAKVGARISVYDVRPDRVAEAVGDYGAAALAAAAVTETPCDIFAPCALGAVLTEPVAARLPARGVCGAANNIFVSDAAAAEMHRRGVVVVPDFIANAGALIQGALWNLRQERIGPDRLDRIGVTTSEVLARARQSDLPPNAVASELARERLAADRPGQA